MIIVVAGFRGSGKSIFGEVARKEGFEVFEMSEPILELMGELGMETTNESVRTFASDFREKGGEDSVAKLLLPRMKLALQERRPVVVIGARSGTEVDAFSNLSRTVTVAIISDEKNRYERTKARGKPSDPKSLDEFRWADRVEAKWGLKKLLDSCEAKVTNDSSREAFALKVKSLLEKCRGG